jgi:hypothetical protein
MVEADSPPACWRAERSAPPRNRQSRPLEVENRDQRLQALRPTRVGRQNRRRKADALATCAAAVTHARAAHSDRTDAGHDLTLGQMPMAHHRRRPSSVSLSAWQLRACARSARAPLRKTSVSGSVKVPGSSSGTFSKIYWRTTSMLLPTPGSARARITASWPSSGVSWRPDHQPFRYGLTRRRPAASIIRRIASSVNATAPLG